MAAPEKAGKAMLKTYAAGLNPLRYEALLGRDRAFMVVGSGTGPECAPAIRALQPDFLLLEAVLAGADSLALLAELRNEMPAPPRVLYLAPEESWGKQALGMGADAAALLNCPEEALLSAAKKTGEKPLPALARGWQAVRLAAAGELTDQLGIADALKGKRYIQWAAAALACAPQLAASYSGRLYPLAAEAFETSPRAVERDIRTAIEHTWLFGSLDAIQAFFGYSVDADRGKPTNAEFLSMLAAHIRLEVARQMAAARE